MNVILNESDIDYLNILVIGNGFDLAHKLPTQYADFLKFCIEVMNAHSEFHLLNSYGNKSPMTHISELLSKTSISESSLENIIVDVCEHLKKNIWYEFFKECYEQNCLRGENWVDFESEMCFCITALDEYTQDMSKSIQGFIMDISEAELSKTREVLVNRYKHLNSLNPLYLQRLETHDNEKAKKDILQQITEIDLNESKVKKKWLFSKSIKACTQEKSINFKQLRERLYKDLERFIEAFEIYIDRIVEKTKIEEKSPDIEATKARYILSFNYTHTFLDTELYRVPLKNRIYVHGDSRNYKQAIGNRNLNIVLGIGEYCDATLRDKHINYIKFKKVFQRLDKQTDEEVEKFFEICKNERRTKRFFIFGHSLDETDEDILKVILIMDNSETTIFCNTTGDKESYRENVIKIIGHDMFFTKIKNKTLEFKMQQPMVKLDSPLEYT